VRERWPVAQILVTSGHVTLADRDLPAGGKFFAKPYTPAAIVTALRSVPAG